MEIRYAVESDYDELLKKEKHVSKDELKNIININREIIAINNNEIIGWLRYNLFWDSIPFMNMIYFLEPERKKGYGEKLLKFWEIEMKNKGFDIVLTSTQSDENAQEFYRKNNYIECGSLKFTKQALEIIFKKKLK